MLTSLPAQILRVNISQGFEQRITWNCLKSLSFLHQPFDIDTCCKCYKCYKPNIGFIAFVSQPFQSQIQLSHNHSSRFVVVVDNVVVVVELVIGEVVVVEKSGSGEEKLVGSVSNSVGVIVVVVGVCVVVGESGIVLVLLFTVW